MNLSKHWRVITEWGGNFFFIRPPLFFVVIIASSAALALRNEASFGRRTAARIPPSLPPSLPPAAPLLGDEGKSGPTKSRVAHSIAQKLTHAACYVHKSGLEIDFISVELKSLTNEWDKKRFTD